MRYFLVVCVITMLIQSAGAEEAKFVGEWEGSFGNPIYSKLVVHEDNSLTYCDVSSCQYINCMKMDFTGSLLSKFYYEDSTGKYEFVRLSDEEIEATFTNVTGDVSTAYYEPE